MLLDGEGAAYPSETEALRPPPQFPCFPIKHLIISPNVVQDRITKLRNIKRRQVLSYEALGHALGVHSQSVFRWLQRGVVPRSRPVLRAIDRFISRNGKHGRRRQQLGRPSKQAGKES